MSIPLNADTLCAGGAIERLQFEMQRVLANIADPNTPAKKPRKVKLEITVTPNEHRNMAELKVTTSSTLQPDIPLETSIIIDKTADGTPVASELTTQDDTIQHQLPGAISSGKVVSIKGVANA